MCLQINFNDALSYIFFEYVEEMSMFEYDGKNTVLPVS